MDSSTQIGIDFFVDSFQRRNVLQLSDLDPDTPIVEDRTHVNQ